MENTAAAAQAFDIPLGEHLLSSALHAARSLWRRLGDLESEVLREQLQAIEIDRPIYIAGLARSGSTILLEMIASHPQVATHRYRDFWSIFTPVWAAQATRRTARVQQPPIERAHRDGIMITPDSPEAIEEMIWMQFFSDLHQPLTNNVLDAASRNQRFESFYPAHIRKLLLIRHKSRYASKANYNLTRLRYLQQLFPDIRFVLPIREPREQIASLRKQHALLSHAAAQYPRTVHYLDRVGHFEFGLHRTPINVGDTETVRQILELWREGEEVRGWARYWSHLYGFVAHELETDERLRDAAMVVKYDELCSDSSAVLSRLFAHCQLPAAEPIIEQYASRLRPPDYYRPHFTPEEEVAIQEETAEVVQRFGWPVSTPQESGKSNFASLTRPFAEIVG